MVPDILRRRIEIPRRPIVQHARITRSTRYEAGRQVIRLERRISDIERLVEFLTDMMFGLVSAFFAIVAVASADVSWQDTICAGVLAFFGPSIGAFAAIYIGLCAYIVLEIIYGELN